MKDAKYHCAKTSRCCTIQKKSAIFARCEKADAMKDDDAKGVALYLLKDHGELYGFDMDWNYAGFDTVEECDEWLNS